MSYTMLISLESVTHQIAKRKLSVIVLINLLQVGKREDVVFFLEMLISEVPDEVSL